MSLSPAAEPFRCALLEQAPRVLSLMDREQLSPTAGCCDRNYWAWKFVDFPGARFQESVCFLSFLYSSRFESNQYAGNPRLLSWVQMGLRFWSGVQHRDGSFDEAYPFERSLAATAFTTFYVGEALELLGPSLDAGIREATQATMRRAGEWLLVNDESHGFLSNHLAAAAGALCHVHRVTGDPRFERRSGYFLDRILARQSREGWYDEYGGADPGYQTHGSFYLARVLQLAGNPALADSLDRAARFLAHFIHPDGSLGGEYASRNTQTYYPAAFEMLAAQSASSSWIAEAMRPSVTTGAAAGLRCIDSYNYFPILNNLVFAFLAAQRRGQAPSDGNPSGEPSPDRLVQFADAGLVRIRRPKYDAFVSTGKGGVIKVFDRARRRLVYNDSGYVGRLHDGRLVSSQYQDGTRVISVQPDRIDVAGGFMECSRPTMTPVRFTLFRLFTLSVGRARGVGQWLKRYLVRVLIYRRRPIDLRFKRSITFNDQSVAVSDEIGGAGGTQLAEIAWAEVLTTIHMGSSRYFIANELEPTGLAGASETNRIDPARLVNGIALRREVRFE